MILYWCIVRGAGASLIPPFDYDDVICGQGTSCLEALQDAAAMSAQVDAVFAPVGGGKQSLSFAFVFVLVCLCCCCVCGLIAVCMQAVFSAAPSWPRRVPSRWE